MADTRAQTVRFAKAWLQSEEAAGKLHGPTLLAFATGHWRLEMSRDANLCRYGTLRFVLDALFDDVLERPDRARELAAIVLDYVEAVAVPTDHYRAFLGGFAWKVYATALRYTGEFPAARDAAVRSQEIFNRVGSLAVEAAKARLCEALALRELGDLDSMLRMAKECAQVFLDHDEAVAYMHARMTEALVLADTKQYKRAIEILQRTAADAESRGDKRTLAICLHNSAEYSRALGDRVSARALDARALRHFEELGTSVEKPSIRWTEALALADEGKVSAAILELYVTRSEFLSLGMNGSAADVGLEVVRLRYQRGEDVTSECIELIETMTRAGMIQPAIEALAYLREQARSSRITEPQIQHVREFVRDVGKGPIRSFLPPPEYGT